MKVDWVRHRLGISHCDRYICLQCGGLLKLIESEIDHYGVMEVEGEYGCDVCGISYLIRYPIRCECGNRLRLGTVYHVHEAKCKDCGRELGGSEWVGMYGMKGMWFVYGGE